MTPFTNCICLVGTILAILCNGILAQLEVEEPSFQPDSNTELYEDPPFISEEANWNPHKKPNVPRSTTHKPTAEEKLKEVVNFYKKFYETKTLPMENSKYLEAVFNSHYRHLDTKIQRTVQSLPQEPLVPLKRIVRGHNIKKREAEAEPVADSAAKGAPVAAEAGIGDTAVEANPLISEDNDLNDIEPDINCLRKINLCGLLPLKSLECVLHCSLNVNALPNPGTKFLFRLHPLFINFPQILCPTFGSIYNKIPTILDNGLERNSLAGFLTALGLDLTGETVYDVEFIKNAPASLFNNLVKFGIGPAFEVVRPIIIMAEEAATQQLADKKEFPQTYGNSLCTVSVSPQRGWYTQLADQMVKHPTTSDIFLRGFWILSRALTQSLPYPIDSLFVSLLVGIKAIIGVDCSLVPFGMHGKHFTCLQPPPIEDVYELYAADANPDADNPYKWLVCGAHQAEIPPWLVGRTNHIMVDDLVEPDALDLVEFPNPDEDYGEYFDDLLADTSNIMKN